MVIDNTYKTARIKRAIENFQYPNQYDHEIILTDEQLMITSQAYSWVKDHFGEPGLTWDYYFRKSPDQSKWWDVYGFNDEKMYTMFVLRWL